jgi:serine/threonine-protein kinase
MSHAPQPSASATQPLAGGPPDLSGKTLGDYVLLRRLGQGGMGQVYLAEQVSLKRKVALKLLRADLAADAVALQRFRIEAEAVARVNHANIVQVYALGEAEGLHFIALEYVEGRTLRDFVEKKGPPEAPVALSIMRQVAAALQRAAELGIVHRDIKPENILLTRKAEIKVADFGLSRIFAADRQPQNLTQTNTTMGTPLYMSPEQVECKPLDPRSDIYSFGVTCYHMLAGRPPFRGETAFEVAVQHVQKDPPPLAQVRPDLPPGLCDLVHRMMAKRPDDRPQTGREIVKEVIRLRDTLAGVTGARPGSVVATGPATPAPSDLQVTQPLPVVGRRGRLRWAVAGSLALAVGVGLLLGWLRHRGAAASAPAPGPAMEAPAAPPNEKQERADLLARLVRQYAHPENDNQAQLGLEAATELGLLYLKDRRLDEAEALFKDLSQTDHKRVRYRQLGQLGEAMVLAFRNRPKESNQQILQMAKGARKAQEKGHARALYWWLVHPQLREMLAEALNYNHINDPQNFPAGLEALRVPPPPPPREKGKAKVAERAAPG